MREDWEYDILGNVCQTGAGGTPLKSKKEYYEGGEIPWLRSGEVGQQNIIETENFITNIGLDNSSAKLFPPNTVLVAMYGATAGETGILRIEATTNQAVCGIYPNSKLIPEFLYYCLLVKNKELVDQAQGNAQPNISQKKIKNLHIPIPPLPEQKRIVEILHEAFEAIDQAKANIERNIKNAEELFQSKLEDVFNKEIQGWNKKKIEDVCDEIFAGGDTPKENFSKDITEEFKIPVIGNAVKNRGLHGFTDEARVTKPSITIAARGSGTGHTEVRKEPYLPVVRLIVLVPNKNQVRLSFLKYVIDNLEILRSGTAIPQLTVPMIKSYSFHIPELEVQKVIEEDLNILRQEIEEIREIYRKRLDSLNELKKSILQKAFSGELTANEQVAA